MVTSYSFEEGKKLGGTILLSETDQQFESRKRSYRNDKIISLFAIVLFPLIPLIIVVYISASLLWVLPPSIVGIPAGCLGYYVSSWCYKTATPAMIFKDGFSIGMDELPFTRFSDVFYLRQSTAKGSSTWYVRLTDGNSVLIPSFLLENFDKYAGDKFGPVDKEGKYHIKKEK